MSPELGIEPAFWQNEPARQGGPDVLPLVRPGRLRFRVLVHAGSAADANVAEEYASYCKGAP